MSASNMRKSRPKKGKGKAKDTFSRSENDKEDQELITHGESYPRLKGLSIARVSLAPSAVRVVLKYGFNTNLVVGAGSFTSQVFAGNGMFDPDITGVGGQPMGFDQWMAIFQRYRVLASTISFNASTPDAPTNDAAIMRVVLVPSAVATSFTTVTAAASQPYAKDYTLNGVGLVTQGGGRGSSGRFQDRMSTDLLTGRSKAAVVSDDLLAGSASTNPSDLWYWHILATCTDGAAAGNLVVQGEIRFLCDLYDRNLLTLSAQAHLDAKRRLEKKKSKTNF